MTRLTLIPLDDRPACAAIPVEIAAVAGVQVETPPPGLRPYQRETPPLDELTAWIAASRQRTDATVASLDAVGFGSLIASRVSLATVPDVLAAWAPLLGPGTSVRAAIVIPRTPNSTDTQEEPAYWNPHGPALHRLSARLAGTDDDLDAALAAVAPDVPREIADEWVGRRLRQHALALTAIHLAHAGRFDTLVIGVDDATATSLSSAAQADLDTWVRRLGSGVGGGAGPGGGRRIGFGRGVLVHPGADEIGSVLVAQALADLSDVAPPVVAIACADPAAMGRIAPYETGPVVHTVRRQLLATGAVLAGGGAGDIGGVGRPGTANDDGGASGSGVREAPHDAVPGVAVASEPPADGVPGDARSVLAQEPDVVLVVHPPTGKPGDWGGLPVVTSVDAARATAALAADLVAAGLPVAVADIAQPNGADPALVAALSERGLWDSLVGYAAWNTAGNTLGTVAAQIMATWVGRQSGTFDADAHRRMIARRIAEDYGWMSVVRGQVRAEIGSRPGFHDTVDADDPTMRRWEGAIADVLAGVLDDVRVVPGSLAFPWNRTFEVDFDVEVVR